MTSTLSSAAAPLPADLLAQELRGPRYTSYPTAMAFGPQFNAADQRAAAQASAASGRPLSLYLHVPFCASNCFYCGCHRVITRSRERIQAYVDTLLAEVDLAAAWLQPAPEVVQLHLGGGTPNSLDLPQLAALLQRLRARFAFAGGDRLEASMEVDPRNAEVGDVRAWRALGFNRLSFGVQDTDPAVQAAINRVQSAEHLAVLTDSARRAGFHSVNYDLVYGLPLQTPDRFGRTLDFVLQQRPDRIAAYHYAHLPQRFAAQRAIADQTLPSAQVRQVLRESIHARLTAAGYVAIGLDHYALPDDALALAFGAGTLQRNFQGYSTQAECDLLGLGVSAISKLAGCYAQNHADMERYTQAIEAGRLATARGYRLTEDDRLRARVIESIMCRGAVDFAALPRLAGRMPAAYLAPELQRLRALDPEGAWLHCDTEGLRVSERGRSLLRVVAMAFDAHLAQAQRLERYSRLA